MNKDKILIGNKSRLLYTGPKGGKYYMKGGKKVYTRKEKNYIIGGNSNSPFLFEILNATNVNIKNFNFDNICKINLKIENNEVLSPYINSLKKLININTNNTVYNKEKNKIFICSESKNSESKNIIGFLGVIIELNDIISYYTNKNNLEYQKYESMYNQHKFLMLLDDVFNNYNYDSYNYSWIEILCVDPKYRGNDIGKLLINQYENFLKEKYNNEYPILIGVDLISTKKKKINQKLIKFYEGLGFTFSDRSNFLKMHGNSIYGYKIIQNN